MDLVEAQRYEKRTRGWLKCKMLCEGILFIRIFVKQIVDIAALGSGMKINAMWHVPHHIVLYYFIEKNNYSMLQ